MSSNVKNRTKAAPLTFNDAVNKVPSLILKDGLGAIKAGYRDKLHIKEPRKLCGSVDIDKDLQASEPHSARWDYAIGHGEKAYFIEFHPADTSNVKEVIKKLEWLKTWLKSTASQLDKLKAEKPYHWIASGRINILPGSREYRLCVSKGITPKESFHI